MRRLLVTALVLAGCTTQPPAPPPVASTPALLPPKPPDITRPSPRKLLVGEVPPQPSPSALPTPKPPPPKRASPSPSPEPTKEVPVEIELTTPSPVEETPVEVEVAPPPGDMAMTQEAPAILSNGQSHLTYVLLEAKADDSQVRPLPLNLALVVDTSRSMQEARKLDYAIDGVKRVLDRLKPGDRATVIVFAQTAQAVLRTGQRGDLNMLVRRTPVGDGTHLYMGLEAGVQEVAANATPETLNQIIVLTDGDTAEPQRCLLAASNARQQGFAVTALGLGKANGKLLQELADGRFHSVSSPNQLPGIYDRELQAVRTVQLRNNRLTLQLEPGVTLRKAHRIKPNIRETLNLGDLRQGETFQVLLELQVPDQRPGTHRVGTATLQHDGPGNPTVFPLEVKFTADRTQAQASSPRLTEAVNAVTRYTNRGR